MESNFKNVDALTLTPVQRAYLLTLADGKEHLRENCNLRTADILLKFGLMTTRVEERSITPRGVFGRGYGKTYKQFASFDTITERGKGVV